jgi:hypothetical protein
MDSDIENNGARKQLKKRRIFKFYKQILYYFKNRQQDAILLSKTSLNFRNNSFKVKKTMNR